MRNQGVFPLSPFSFGVRMDESTSTEEQTEGVMESMMADDPFQVDAGQFMLKATAREEDGKRFIYTEPSNENQDAQNERVMRKALAASAEHYLKFGNIDIEHLTLVGQKHGMSPIEAESYEIGLPIEVKTEPKILVKGEVYQGREKSDWFWKTLTAQTPAKRWYPSVGGRVDPSGKTCRDGTCVVKAVLWTNIGFAKEPVNRTVKAVSLLPLDDFLKAVTAGYGTDVATFTGGRALQLQSIHGKPIKQTLDFTGPASRYLKAVASGGCEHATQPQTLAKIVSHFEKCEGLPRETSRQFASWLIEDVGRRLKTNRRIAA